MPRLLKPILYAGAGGAGVAAALTAYLQHRYPVYEATSEDLPVGVWRTLPYNTHPRWQYCEARVPARTTVQQTRPMDSFVRQFYDIWTMRVEEALARAVGYEEKFFPPPYTKQDIAETHCGGLFPQLQRNATTCMVFFGPGGAVPAMADLQVFEAAPDGDGLRLRFYTGNVDIPSAATDEGLMGWLHMMYLRFLLDAVQRKMRREKEGELPAAR